MFDQAVHLPCSFFGQVGGYCCGPKTREIPETVGGGFYKNASYVRHMG